MPADNSFNMGQLVGALPAQQPSTEPSQFLLRQLSDEESGDDKEEARARKSSFVQELVLSTLQNSSKNSLHCLGGPPATAATQEDDFVSKLASSAAAARPAVAATAVQQPLSNPRAAQQLVQRLETSAAVKDEEWDEEAVLDKASVSSSDSSLFLS